MPTLKRHVESALGPAIRRFTGRRARILMYHRPDPRLALRAAHVAAFEQQLLYLRRHFKVRPLSEVVARLEAREAPEPNTVVITVDDGYREFFDLTYPLLLRYELPATVYVVSEFASGRCWLWFDALRWLTLQARAGSHALSIAGVDCTVRLESPAERQLAWTTLSAICMPLDAVTRGHAISQLQERLGVALPERPVAEYASMEWSQLRALDARLIEVGAHTRTHTRLTSCTLEGQREEIAGCKSEIEHNVGRPVEAFCYPNGMPEDFSAQSAALVHACGFRSAVQAFGGLVGSDSNLFGLARVSAPTDFAQFRNCVNGLWSLRETHMDGAAAT